MASVEQVLTHDAWTTAEGEVDAGPFILRFRTPIVSRREAASHPYQLVVCWPYAPEDSAAMPTDSESREMVLFEDRLCEAWEHDGLGFLAAVLTLDGARQWLFYTLDVSACEERLAQMPQESEPYPIELTTEKDADWSYLREDILGGLDLGEHEAGWEEALRRGLD